MKKKKRKRNGKWLCFKTKKETAVHSLKRGYGTGSRYQWVLAITSGNSTSLLHLFASVSFPIKFSLQCFLLLFFFLSSIFLLYPLFFSPSFSSVGCVQALLSFHNKNLWFWATVATLHLANQIAISLISSPCLLESRRRVLFPLRISSFSLFLFFSPSHFFPSIGFTVCTSVCLSVYLHVCQFFCLLVSVFR